jgi:DNA polymerase-3 subunit delta
MKISLDQLAPSLEKSLAPLYLVAGPEPLLIKESLDLIIAEAKKQGFLERTVLHVGKNFDWGSLESASMDQSLFSSRKVLDLRMPTAKPGTPGSKALVKWTENPDPDVLLIVSCESWEPATRKAKWAGELTRAGTLVEIWPVKTHEMPAWVERRMQRAGLEPDKEAVQLLAELLEGNLLAAQQEIDKLALLNPDKKVDANMVRQSVSDSSRFGPFKLGEYMLSGQAEECLKVASSLSRTGVAIQVIIGSLYYQMNQLNSAFIGVSLGEDESRVFSRLRIFNMAQPLYRSAIRRLSEKQIGDAFLALALIERQGKGRAAGDPWQTLDQMIVALCANKTRPRSIPALA